MTVQTEQMAHTTQIEAVGGHEEGRAAIDKAISLLTCFGAQATSGVGVSELARRADLSKSTAFRVLGLLERNGVVERVGRKYRLGARLHELGRNVYAPTNDRLRDRLIPFMTDLYEATHETVQLATLHDVDVVYLAKLYGHRSAPSPIHIGTRLPAYATACGLAQLAHQPQALDRLIEQSQDGRLAAVTSHTTTDLVDLQMRLSNVRRQGIAYDKGGLVPGQHCIAVPVLGPGGYAVAAFSISAPIEHDLRPYALVLRRVGAAASQALQRGPVARQATRSA